MAEDRQLDDRERRLIGQLADQQGIADPLVTSGIDEALLGELDPPQSTDRVTSVLWLARMVDAALVDGRIERDERGLLAEWADHLGMSKQEFKQTVRACWFDRQKRAQRTPFDPPH